MENVLLDEKSDENILIYVLYKSLIGAKVLHIRFDTTNELIRVYGGTRYLVLFYCQKYDTISKIKHFIGLKSGTMYVFSYNYVKIKMLTLHDFVTHITAVLNKDHYNYNTFLEKCFYQ